MLLSFSLFISKIFNGHMIVYIFMWYRVMFLTQI